MSKKILIVDDHPMFAEALRSAIRSSILETEFEYATSIREAADAYMKSAFDLVLLDLWLPDNQGFNGLIELRRQRPKIPIIVISAFEDQKSIHYSMLCGAAGYIPKSASKSAVVQSIKSVLAGDLALPDAFLPPEPSQRKELETPSRLTLQELRVLQLLCQGMLNKQIAHELDVCETTVKAHVSKILSKFHVSSRTQAVVEASKFCLSPVLAFQPAKGRSNELSSR